MCKDLELFTYLEPTLAVIVLGDGTKLRADRKGNVNLPTACDVIHLPEVLFFPTLAVSLLSIARASYHRATCTFLPANDGVYIEKSGSLLCIAS